MLPGFVFAETEVTNEEIESVNNEQLLAEQADDTKEIVTIQSDWKGTVFGDVGGNDKITSENFEITESEDQSVKLRVSNDRGKISGETDGIAYYYKALPDNADFELKATATVEQFDANNQVAFGIMLRDDVHDFVSGKDYGKGNYLALGALKQKMQAFSRENGKLNELGWDQAHTPDLSAQFQLSLKKMGELYIVSINDETKIIDNYSGDSQFIGLFASRNTEVNFTNIDLKIEEDEEIELGDWEFDAFGSNTSAEKNLPPQVDADGSVTIEAKGGKIASSEEGISYYYQSLDSKANFELKAKARVNQYNLASPKQVSFGLMLRDEVGDGKGNYVAVGALETDMRGFYSHGSQTKLDVISQANAPAANEVYDLSIKKSGDTFVLSVNGEAQEPITADGIFEKGLYAGLYVARDASVTFSDIELNIDSRKITSLSVDSSEMKTNYLVNEKLDTTNLQVTAEYSDGTSETVTDYVVTGFDSSEAGVNTITIHYGGQKATIDLVIEALSVESLAIKYYPAKTTYYIGDRFDAEGLVLEATYDNGETMTLPEDLYTIKVEDTFTSAGTKTIEITSVETPEQSISFEVTVNDSQLEKIEVTKQPEKTGYFLNDELDLDGMTVYAHYSDGSKVRLMNNEYTVSAFDSSTVGEKTLTITHKNQQTKLTLTVKEKELIGLEIASYPKTTYELNQTFDETNLRLVKVYDNGDTETYETYKVQAPTLDQVGKKMVKIIPNDTSLNTIELPISVIEKQAFEWHATHFGQSTNAAKNTVTEQEDGSIHIEAQEGAGKVTGDHDGISYYYTELDPSEDNFVLSATIDVKKYAKEPHDGQESFGIMARDVNGPKGDSSVFASNIAVIGGFSGGTGNENGIQLYVRTGVESPDGAGSQGIQKEMLEQGRPSGEYRLTLEKTNSGFVGKIDNGEEAIIFEPEILTAQDSGKMYVGFFAARLAEIVVSDIELTVTKAETDAPKVDPPKEAITPTFDIVSLKRTSDKDYTFRYKANVDGTVTIKQGNEIILTDKEVTSGNVHEVQTTIEPGLTNFSVTFLPEDTQYLTDYHKIVSNFTVEMRSYDGDIFVSPDGRASGAGTKEDPLDLDTAIEFVQAGQRIIVQDGTYTRNSKLEFKKYNDGKEGAMKSLVAEEGARPVIDFDKKSEGGVLSGNYWHIKGLDFTNSAGNKKGFTVGGSYNIIEDSHFYHNGDTGLQISRTDDANNIEDWPSYNLILNSTSHDNRDPSGNNADGFAAKLTSGVGNVFRGCIAYNNIDDGWDLYAKAGSGAIGAVVIEDSIAYNNGFVSDENDDLEGDGNGFKLGGEGIHVQHVIRNSMAFNNLSAGITSNSNPGVIAENNISFNNGGANLQFSTYTNIEEDFTIDGFISYQKDHTSKDVYPSELVAANNYFFDGKVSKNVDGVQLTDRNFESLETDLPFTRDENGDIEWGNFLAFIDLHQLESLIAEAKALDVSDPSAAETLATAIQKAEDALASLATVAELDDALAALQDAMDQAKDEEEPGAGEGEESEDGEDDDGQKPGDGETEDDDKQPGDGDDQEPGPGEDQESGDGDNQEAGTGDGEGQESVNEDDQDSGDGTGNESENDVKPGEEQEDGDTNQNQESNQLPNTATSNYNLLAVAAGLIIIGGVLLMVTRKGKS